MYEYTSFSLYNINVSGLKKSALSQTDPLGLIWTAPLDVQKYQRKIPLRLLRWMSKRYGLMRRHIFWGCFLPLQLFATNSI